jgi:hypothetical protein
MDNDQFTTPNPNSTPGAPQEYQNIKYPFSGIAPNLIDKFLVLGYEQKVIEHTYKNNETEPKYGLKTRFQFYDFEERPSIVNEICYDYLKDLLDNDLILELVFPNLPQMYYLDKLYINTPKELDEELLTSPYSIIFSINPQDNSGSKKSYNCLGYVFYIPVENRINGEMSGFCYVPVAYVILSEFPYFYHFNEICKNVYFQMKKENDEIPIDIILYNTVKFAPSPINKSINLSFGAPLGFAKTKNNIIEDILADLNNNSLKEKKGIPQMFFNQLSGYPFMDINLSFIFNLIPPEIIVEVFIFSFLEHDIIFYSSRPEILNMVMYIFSNLNYPFNDSIYYWHVLSVSEDSFMSGASTFVGKTCSTITGILNEYDPELLTTKKIREHFVLDIDNKNFFFLYQEESEDVKETMCLYNYIKECVMEAEENGGDSKNDKDTRTKNYNSDGLQLYDVIKNLMEELQRRAKKVTSTNYNEKIEKPTFLTMYEDESEMECMEANMRLQKAFFTFITQIMQNFVRILSIGDESKDKDNLSDKGISPIVINIKKEDKDNNNEEEEENKRKLAAKAGRIFKEKFQDCSKYSSFVINFCKHHETIDLYKIPYTFINEFVYYSHIAVKNNLSEVDVFKLIDQFYGKRKMIDFEEIISQKERENKRLEEAKSDKNKKKDKKKNLEKTLAHKGSIEIIDNTFDIINKDPSFETDLQNIYLFTFDKFSDFYKDNLRAFINREQDDDREIFSKVKATNKNFKKYKRNNFYLSNKILSTYITFVNNNTEELKKQFELVKCEYKSEHGESSIKEEDSSSEKFTLFEKEIDINKLTKEERIQHLFGTYELMEITDVIERHFILERCFSSYGLIKFSLLNVLAVTRGLEEIEIKNKDVITTMCDFCEKTKSLVRRYMNIYLNIFKTLKLRGILKDKIEYEECLNIISLYFKKTNMIPTEETTKAFNEIKLTEYLNSSNKILNHSNKENNNEERFKELVQKNGKFFEVKEGIFSSNPRKKFEDILKTIETVFDGIYKSSIVSFDCKELEKLYEQIRVNNDKFLPLTPLRLYNNTYKILSEYLKNFYIDKHIYQELGKDILSLLYYFKIPIIGLKWVEQYNVDDKLLSVNTLHKEKAEKKSKEQAKIEEKKDSSAKELKEILKKIIAILIDLFKINKKKINN